MPNRIIKETIKRSPEIDRLTWFEEVVFYRLIVTADDYGRLDGRMIVLKNDLFPTKDTITKKSIEDAINKLVSVGLLVPYVDAESDMPYLVIRKWEKHQTVRNKYSRFPAPPDDLMTNCKQSLSNCKQTSANCRSESESKIESESESESIERRARTRFTPPTLDAVSAYAKEKGWTEHQFNAERFVDFYASKGWKVGRDTMKDWKAAARGWVSRQDEQPKQAVRDNPFNQYEQREYKTEDFGDDFFVDLEHYGEG